MEINKEYIQRVLKIGEMESTIEGNYVILNRKTPQGWTVKLSVYPKDISIDVWIEIPPPEKGAWVEVNIPIPQTANAYVSQSIRWVVNMILIHDELPIQPTK